MDSSDSRYAGLGRVHAAGLSVGESAERLRRFAYVEERLMRLLASRMVTLPERDIIVLLGRLQYEAAQHADGWRRRILELRTNKNKLNAAPDPALAVLFDDAEYLPGTYVFLVGVTQLLLPALHDAYAAYSESANELADYATVRQLREALADVAEHQRLLKFALAGCAPGAAERAQADEWLRTLRDHLAAAGGVDGTQPRIAARERVHAQTPYQIAHTLTRDTALPRVWDYVAPALDEVPEHLGYLMSLRLSEINVSEGLAIVLFETRDMPWSFYLDISRHCWDETRHSLFGEAGIEATYGRRDALPLRDYEGIFALEAAPIEQYAVLGLEVEGKNMRYPPGKRQEWEFARDMARHPLMTTLQDFDWADEVVHVNIARRQLSEWFTGGVAGLTTFAKQGGVHRTEVKHRHPATRLPRPQPIAVDAPELPAEETP